MKIILEELSEVFMFNFDKIIISEQKKWIFNSRRDRQRIERNKITFNSRRDR